MGFQRLGWIIIYVNIVLYILAGFSLLIDICSVIWSTGRWYIIKNYKNKLNKNKVHAIEFTTKPAENSGEVEDSNQKNIKIINITKNKINET